MTQVNLGLKARVVGFRIDLTRRMSVLWLINAYTRINPLWHPKQNGPGITPGAVSF
jgi:hypothetical protein